MPQKLALKKLALITGPHFYKQFGCQMPRFRRQNASALFSYILYLIIPLQPIAAGGNFGGNRYKNCVQRVFLSAAIEKMNGGGAKLCNEFCDDSILVSYADSYATTIVCSSSPLAGITCSGRNCSSRENSL
jgi:hypothetical protein